MTNPNRTDERARAALEAWQAAETSDRPRDVMHSRCGPVENWRAAEGCAAFACLPSPATHPSVTLCQRPSIQALADAVVPGWDSDSPPPEPVSPRDSILHGALKAVSTRDNEAAYGTGNNFDAAARIEEAILSACHTEPPRRVRIAVTQIAVKLARLAGSGFKHEDSAVDLCGYTAWAFQLATDPAPQQKI